MDLFIIKKRFSLRDQYDIVDKDKKIRYTARGNLFAPAKKLAVLNVRGENIAWVKAKLNIVPSYGIRIEGMPDEITVTREPMLHGNFKTDYRGWSIEGDLLGFRFRLLDQKRVGLMYFERVSNTWENKYLFRYMDLKNEVFYLCIALAIFAAMEAVRKSQQSD